MVGVPKAAINLVKILAIIGVVVFVINMIFNAGGNSMKAEMQPLYDDLNERYNKVHLDLSILNADAVAGDAATKFGFELVGVKTEVDHVKREAKIKADATAYYNKLFTASGGVLGYPKNESDLYTSENPRRTLSSLVGALSDSCEGKQRLYNDLRELDREFAEQILVPSNFCQEGLRDITSYSQKIDKNMEVQREINKANEKKVGSTDTTAFERLIDRE